MRITFKLVPSLTLGVSCVASFFAWLQVRQEKVRLHQEIERRSFLAAAAMLMMVPLSLDEIVATVQFLNYKRRAGESVWRAFWRGGSYPPGYHARPAKRASWTLKDMLSGVTASWTLYACALLGVWLMLSPWIFGSEGRASNSDHLMGALIITVSVTALGEVGRSARFINVLLGATLIPAALFLEEANDAGRLNSIFSAIAVILLSLPLGKVRDHYGTFDPFVIWPSKRKIG